MAGLTDPVLLIAVLAVVGGVAGLLAGLLGVGGGIVVVPALFHLLGLFGVTDQIRMHVAVATSLATIVPTAMVSMRAHLSRQAVDTQILRQWGPWVVLGVLIGTGSAVVVRGQVLTAVFAGMALAVAAHMIFTPEGKQLTDRPPTGWVRAVLSMLVGGFSAMMGIGGGTLMVPTLVLSGFPIRQAVGTASAVGLIIAIPGTVGFMLAAQPDQALPPYSIGYVNLAGFCLLAPTMMLAAPWGARLAHSLRTDWLRRVFALFLVLTSARMIAGLF